MWKVTLRGLWTHKLRFLLSAAAVVLGVAFLTGTRILTDTIQATFDDLFADVNAGTDSYVRGREQFKSDFAEESERRPPVPASLLDSLRALPSVAEAQPDVNLEGVALITADDDPLQCRGPSLGFAWSESEELNPWTIVEGSAPASRDEVVIDRRSARDGEFEVGDTVRVTSKQPTKTYTVSGIAVFGNVDRPAGATVAMFRVDEAQRLGSLGDAFSGIGVVAVDGASQEQVTADIRGLLAQSDFEALTGDQLIADQQNELSDNIAFLRVGLSVFAAIALLVGSFIIYNTFRIMLAQRTRELALLRAIGASPNQIRVAVVGEAVVLGGVSSALGVAGGAGLAVGLKALIGAFGFTLPGSVVVRLGALVLGFVVGTAVTVACAALPARRAARLAPLAALRDVAYEKSERRWIRGLAVASVGGIGLLGTAVGLFSGAGEVRLAALGAFLVYVAVVIAAPLLTRPVARLFALALRWRGMVGRLATENVRRNPKRSAWTAVALMIGVSFVGFITIFGASAKASINDALDEQIATDLTIAPSCAFSFSGMSPEVATRVRKLDEVDTAGGIAFGGFAVAGRGGEPKAEFFSSGDVAALGRIIDVGVAAGSVSDLAVDEVGLFDDTAADYGVELGDELMVQFASGPARLRVGAIYTRNELAGGFFISSETHDKHLRDRTDAFVFVVLRDSVNPTDGRDAIASVLADFPGTKVQNIAEFKADQGAQIDFAINIIYALLGLAVIIAVLGIANTLALSIHERTRELGLLRAVGCDRAQVRAMVRWEAVMLSLLGVLLGVGVGLFWGWVIVRGLEDQGFTRLDVAPVQLVVVFALGAFAGVVASVRPAWRASRLDVLQAIATE